MEIVKTINPQDARDTFYSCGSRRVVCNENAPGRFSSRLWVNHGETATLTCAKHRTAAGVARWASKILSR